MRIELDPKLDFSDVLIKPKRSTLTSRKDVDLFREYKFRNSGRMYSGIPIIAANMDTVGTFRMAEQLNKHGLSVAIHKHYSAEELVNFFGKQGIHNFYSIGLAQQDLSKYDEVCDELEKTTAHIPHLCVDVANGYTQTFVDFVKRLRERQPGLVLMVGNVVTAEMTEELILAGADIVKVGIGPGSVCTTRKVAGVGYPQLSAIIECADAAHGLGGHICADGGCTTPGDVAKAFGAGADFVMLGGMLAGHDECDGELVYGNGVKSISTQPTNAEDVYFNIEDGAVYLRDPMDPTFWKKTDWPPECFLGTPTHMKFYGMSSKAAMDKHNGGVAEYRASEGKEVLVPYRGPVENTVREILGGVRSACTYTGAKSLKELSKRTTFVLVGQTHNKIFGE